jgi:hypothetical protein
MIMMTSFKYEPKMSKMIHSLMRVSNEVIQISLDYMFEVVERKGHSPLKSFSDIFKDERNFPVCKHTPRKNKRSLMLILGFNLDLTVA